MSETLASGDRQKLLIETILRERQFDEATIIEQFKRKTGGSVSVGIGQTIRSILHDLTEFGMLRYENHRYSVES